MNYIIVRTYDIDHNCYSSIPYGKKAEYRGYFRLIPFIGDIRGNNEFRILERTGR